MFEAVNAPMSAGLKLNKTTSQMLIFHLQTAGELTESVFGGISRCKIPLHWPKQRNSHCACLFKGVAIKVTSKGVLWKLLVIEILLQS
jgi:hypothetical protein